MISIPLSLSTILGLGSADSLTYILISSFNGQALELTYIPYSSFQQSIFEVC